MSINKEEAKAAARGRWREILMKLGGIPPKILDGKHHPCPRCGGTDRFRALDDFEQTGAVLCNQCFNKGNGDGIATLCWITGWGFSQTLEELGKYLGLSPSNTHRHEPKVKRAPSVVRSNADGSDAEGGATWQPLWDRANPATESDVGLYLPNRGLTFAPHEDCRFAPKAKAKLKDGSWHEGPAMLWLVRGAADGEPVAVHRTFLSKDCKSKASIDGCKRLLGKPGPGAAIRLTPAEGDTLVVCEGVETGLSIVIATKCSVWCLTSSSAFQKFVPPANIKTIVIAADNDEAGLKAANEMAANKLHSKGPITVRIAKPLKEGQDFNDLLKAEGKEAVASVIASAKPWEPPDAPPDNGDSDGRPVVGSPDGDGGIDREPPRYEVRHGRLCKARVTRNKDDETETNVFDPLANFSATITKEIVRDDGLERTVWLTLEGKMDSGESLPPIDVPSEEFDDLKWLGKWGAKPTVYPPNRNLGEVRAAIRLLSEPTRETRFAMTGWQKIGGVWHYLHAGGAIGPNGARHDVMVELPGALAGIRLPDPPTRKEDAVDAIRQTLDAWRRLATDPITLPVLAAVFRSPLGPTPFAVWLFGSTGTRKSCVAGLAQAFFGAGFNHDNLTANWSNTPTATEHAQFTAKDCLVVADDFRPSHGRADREKQEALAERVLRSQGNLAARQRCRNDATLRPPKDPRCTMLSTGEELPSTPSLQARLFTVELKPDSIDLPVLTECQRLAREGVFASVMAAYLQWLARGPRIESIRDGLNAERERLRGEIVGQFGEIVHGRTPDQIADLLLGWRHFLAFAVDVGAQTDAEVEDCLHEVQGALLTVAREEAKERHAETLVEQFLRGVREAIAAGNCHLAAPDGERPTPPERWGWMAENNTWRPCDNRVGWVKDGEVYLLPKVAMKSAGVYAPVRALGAMLRDAKLLLKSDADRQTRKVRAQGATHNVWAIADATLNGTIPEQNCTNTSRKEAA